MARRREIWFFRCSKVETMRINGRAFMETGTSTFLFADVNSQGSGSGMNF
jgi:hypothetical protein